MTLSLDIETYSETDIKKCGSFRYIDDPAFEIMLFAFAFDSDTTTVIDFTDFEEIPRDVRRALYTPGVIKTGWNNAFERYALWKYFGEYMPPEQWEDTMVLAAQCGLPLGLGDAGKALLMPSDAAKMKEGKALINYFCKPCKPSKANGRRARNMPWDAPDRWGLFKTYNGQDVVAERSIRDTLLQWRPSELEHRFWCLDARINERGIKTDLPLVKNALEMDRRYKEELSEQAIALSGLQNPSSVLRWETASESGNGRTWNRNTGSTTGGRSTANITSPRV